MNFQAAVTTVAAIHALSGSPLKWLDGITEDIPIEVSAETGGAGDDLKLDFRDGANAEIQVKKGLRVGAKLWAALTKLALAIVEDNVDFGILVVCPNTSRSIRDQLAKDIRRLGSDRTDSLSATGQKLAKLLESANIDVLSACQRLRITTVHALAADQASVLAARAQLQNICAQQLQVQATWDYLYKDAHQIIEDRSARTAASLASALTSAGIEIRGKNSDSPAQLFSQHAAWTKEINSSFSIWGIKQKLSLDEHWIDIPIAVSPSGPLPEENSNIDDALSEYRNWTNRKSDASGDLFAPVSVGRFYRHVVVISGPGMGKTTLLKKLALQYSREALPTIKVSLRLVAQRMRSHGESLIESAINLGLANSGISPSKFKAATGSELVFLCDGLDECGHDRGIIAEELAQLALGHPHYRIIVTTRPLGYTRSILEDWRHYEILPLPEDSASRELSSLIDSIVGSDDDRAAPAQKYAQAFFEKSPVNDLIARSPLLLSLVASLAIHGVTFEQKKSRLYAAIFRLFDAEPNDKLEALDIDNAVAHRVLDILAFNLVQRPTMPSADLFRLSSRQLANELNCSELQAKREVTKCANYWERLGVIERLHYSQGDILSFVHLTFTEYAAARYLSSLSDPELIARLPAIISSTSFAETISFASEMEKAELVYLSLREADASISSEQEITKACLKIAALSDPPLSSDHLNELVEECLTKIQSDEKSETYELSELLGAVTERFPDLLGPKLSPLLDHQNSWTRLIAWDCILRIGGQYYSLEHLTEAATILCQECRPIEPSLGGGIALRTEGGNTFHSFRLQTAREVLTRAAEEEARETISTIFGDRFGMSFYEMHNLQELLEEHGKMHFWPDIDKTSLHSSSKMAAQMERSDNSMWAGIERMFGVIAGDCVSEKKPASHYLFNVSALLEQSGFWDTLPGEVRVDDETHDLPLIDATLRALAEVSGLSLTALRQEARAFLDILRSSEKFRLSLLTSIAPRVDVPPPCWSTKEFEFDREALKNACFLRSQWVSSVAGYILSNTVEGSGLVELCDQLIAKGTGETLLIAMNMALETETDEVVPMILSRLNNEVKPGFEYLFRYLCNTSPPWDKHTLKRLERGLINNHPTIASSASLLAREYTHGHAPGLSSLLERAYSYWQETEEPYPNKSGFVPKSPRNKILECLTTMRTWSLEELLVPLNDPRSDVVAVAQSKLIEKIRHEPNVRQEYVDGLVSGEIKPRRLSQILDADVGLSGKQAKSLTSLLFDSDEKTRFEAMTLLDLKYLPLKELNRLCRVLEKKDEHAQIRSRAQRIRKDLSTS